MSLLLNWCVPFLGGAGVLLVYTRLRGRIFLRQRARNLAARVIRRVPALRPVAEAAEALVITCPHARTRHLLELTKLLINPELCSRAVAQASTTILREPDNRYAHILRGFALHRLGKLDEALHDYQVALTLPPGSDHETNLLYHYLSQLLVILGEIELAALYAYARAAVSRGLPDPAASFRQLIVDVGDLRLAALYADAQLERDDCHNRRSALRPGFVPRDAYGMQLHIDAHNDLAEELINSDSNFEGALRVYARKSALQEMYREAFGFGSPRILYLPDDWVRNIGHLALLDFWAKIQQLGWVQYDRMVLLAPENTVANRCYLGYWKKYFNVISDPHLISSLAPFAVALGSRVASRLELPDGQEKYFCDAMGLIQQEWEQQGRSSLLDVPAPDRSRGRQRLSHMGLPPDAWFVCLHVRSPGYHREHTSQHQAHRNADIHSYLPALHEITKRGGWVIRLGDPSMEPLPYMPNVIDYAHSPDKSDWMDVFLISSCRFFLGVASGLCNIPTTFGVPSVLTNWVSNHLPVYSEKDLFVPKLCWSEVDKRLLTFDEFYNPSVRRLNYSNEHLQFNGLRVLDNSAEEIREVVQEMFAVLEGRLPDNEQDQNLLAEFNAIATRHGLGGFSRIGPSFLRKYAELLAPAPTTLHFPETQREGAPDAGRRQGVA